MVNTVNSAFISAWFGQSSTTTGVGADLLSAWATSKAGVGVTAPTSSTDPNAPLAPVWQPGISPQASALVTRALANKPFFDTGAKLYSDLGATGDYKRLFVLYSGLTTLNALAGRAGETDVSKSDLAKVQAEFTRGVSELQAFFANEKFEDVRMVQADRVESAQTTLAMTTKTEDYTTPVIHRGGLYATLTGLASDAKFNIVATSAAGTERNVAIDLSQMGSIPRSLSNVISFINNKLSAAGAASRLEAVDKTPKEQTLIVGGQPVKVKYTGPKQYALKVDVRANERVAFAPVAAKPAFYAVGDVNGGARLIKLEDTSGAAGQPVWLERPATTAATTGPYVSEGWQPDSGSYEQRSNAMMSAGETNNVEVKLRAASEAVLKLQLADGRTLSVSTAWRSDDQENWLGSDDASIMGDLAERLTELLHEQGVAASVQAWEDSGNHGLSVLSDDHITVSSLNIGGRPAQFEAVDPPGMVGGLRDGVFARRFDAAAVAGASDLFVGEQTVQITTSSGTQTLTVDGGDDGIDATALAASLNTQLHDRGISAAASLVDVGGALTLRIDTLHDVLSVNATFNDDDYEAVIQAPGAWTDGGLPVAAPGQPFADTVRTSSAASSPLLTNTGALAVSVVVATPTGQKTINVAVSALERANDPDPAPGEWSATFKARLDAALNEAGVYVSASSDLTQWSAAEDAGHRIMSVSVNGNALALESDAPAFGLGGAFSADRSFTSANAATAINDDVSALLSNQNVSITFNTAWGAKTVSAVLQPGDPRTLESAALRLNEALAGQGYDLGVAATALSGGGAGLRLVTGSTHTVRGISDIKLGGVSYGATLDPVNSQTYGANPPGALRVSERAARGAAIVETTPGTSYVAPSNGVANWFPGRDFDVAVGGGTKVATAQAVATAADGSVYVVADLSADSATSAIKGARDMALFKYDSAGALVFTQMLGASQSANGFALAVSADGQKVAIAGSVEGALSGAGVERGGTDSFVSMFDASGKEVWTQRRGASANDEARAISFTSSGSVVIAGRTESALGPALSAGGSDAYVRGFNASGLELFQKQFGTTGDDAATALLVRDSGSGGIDIFTGGVESNRGVVRSFSYSTAAGFAAGATRDLGYFYKGAINALAVQGGALYVGGDVGADRLSLGAPAQGAVAGVEGFVARIDDDLVSTGLDRASYLGSAADDSVKSLAIVGSDVYAAGVTGGVINGVGTSGAKSSFITRLGADGEAEWTRAFTSVGGAMSLKDLAVDTSGGSALDALGLPRGVIAARDTNLLTSRSALRVGDEFQIGINSRRLTTIKISATDTLASLQATIARSIGAGGRVEIVRENGVERLKITATSGHAVRLEPSKNGRDALSALGLKQGVIALKETGRDVVKTFGLSLVAGDLRLNDKASIASTKAELSAAISMVRQAYDALLHPNAKEQTAEEKALEARRQSAGAAPEYYTAQLANYQAALRRLGG